MAEPKTCTLRTPTTNPKGGGKARLPNNRSEVIATTAIAKMKAAVMMCHLANRRVRTTDQRCAAALIALSAGLANGGGLGSGGNLWAAPGRQEGAQQDQPEADHSANGERLPEQDHTER